MTSVHAWQSETVAMEMTPSCEGKFNLLTPSMTGSSTDSRTSSTYAFAFVGNSEKN